MKLKCANMVVEFKLEGDKRLIELKEDYCIFMDIDIFVNNSHEKHRHIKASRTIIDKFIFNIRKFIEEDKYEVDFYPPEENFYLNIRPNKQTKQEIINGLREAKYPDHVIEEIHDYIETYKLIICIDSCFAGVSYMLQVTKDQLLTFINTFEDNYKKELNVI